MIVLFFLFLCNHKFVILSRLVGESSHVGEDGEDIEEDENSDCGDGEMNGADESVRSRVNSSLSFLLLIPLSSFPLALSSLFM